MKFITWIVCMFFVVWHSHGQSREPVHLFNVALRSVPLEEALAEFSSMSGAGVTYNPRLIDGQLSSCVVSEASAEEVLRCILAGTHLTYARLSSGTFAILQSGQLPPQHGYIAGVVRDRTTGRPLPEAHIQLASLTMDMGAISNQQGQFTFPPLLPGRYLMQTSYVGYHRQVDTLHVIPTSQSFFRVELEAEPITILPIVIDGIQHRQLSENLNEYHISPEQGAFSDGQTLNQRFEAVPGLRMNDITADAHLQGSNAGEHQFRLDGAPVFLPQNSIGLIGPFSPFAIQSLSVHKSGYGVQEGSHLAGVIEAQHVLEATSTVDAQLDLSAFNGRITINELLQNDREFKLMIAGRTSLWSMFKQEPLHDMLNDWSKPDLFMLFAPTQQYSEIAPSFFQDTLNINSTQNTDLVFSDVHMSGSIQTGPFSGINVSFYRGYNEFAGSLLPEFISLQSLDTIEEDPAPPFPGNESNLLPIELSVADKHAWENVEGQVQFHTILGNSTLLTVQALASTYELNQTYFVVDSLDQFLTPPEDAVFFPVSLEFSTQDITDFNGIDEFTFTSTIDHSLNQHNVLLGIESTVSKSRFDLLISSLPELEVNPQGTPPDLETGRIFVRNTTQTSRHAFFAQDRYSLSKRVELELGSRLTYLPSRQTVYAEPRFAIRYDARTGRKGAIALQTAGGLYRQFLLQLDSSTLNVGALFPSKRIWLLIDEHIRPPLAYHLTQSILWSPSEDLSIQAETFAKFQQRILLQGSPPSSLSRTQVPRDTTIHIDNPTSILSQGRGITSGFSIATRWTPGPFNIDLLYEYTSIRRRSNALFNNAWVSAPWEEPHRFTAGIEWLMQNRLLLSARFNGVWERSWGYRQAYYDFFGHSDLAGADTGIDFGAPDSHVLPPLYQLDLGLVYTQHIKKGFVQFRFDLINALDRKNVADWRLVWEDNDLVRENRYYYPRIPSAAIRVSW